MKTPLSFSFAKTKGYLSSGTDVWSKRRQTCAFEILSIGSFGLKRSNSASFDAGGYVESASD